MIIHIPVRRKTLRINGADVSVLEVANGFVSVSTDQPYITGVESDRLQISNPLSEWGVDLYNRGLIGTSERIQIALEELPNGNPGLDDESTSLVHLDSIV